jgi:hypothetical protein
LHSRGSLAVVNGNAQASIVSETKNTLTAISRLEGFGRQRVLAKPVRFRQRVLDAAIDDRKSGDPALERRVIESLNPFSF